MYIHLGNNVMIKSSEVIGIFDLDSTSVSKKTRDFLNIAQKRKKIKTISLDLPKSFVVCNGKYEKNTVYLSQLSSSTLLKRSGYIDSI